MTEEEAETIAIETGLQELSWFIPEGTQGQSRQDIESSFRKYILHCERLNYLTPRVMERLREEAHQRAERLILAAEKAEDLKANRLRSLIGLDEEADSALVGQLLLACNGHSCLDRPGAQTHYVYLKNWTTEAFSWYKIGITNDPSRRDGEQNVLPVPAKTLTLLAVQGADRARAIERSIHKVLVQRKIVNAGNRELFALEARQVAAIVGVMKQLGECESIC